MEETIITKMAVKTLGCNPRAASAKQENDKSPVKLCIVAGTADNVVTKEDGRGQLFSYLTGDFRGQVVQEIEGPDSPTGKYFRSGKLFLPGGIQETVENAVREAQKNNGPGMVTFGLEISAVRASNPIGYSYTAKPLMKPVATDPLNMIWNQIAAPAEPEPAAKAGKK